MLLPNCTAKFFKQNYLSDLMSHKESSSQSNLRPATQAYFIRHSIKLINDHLTFQDEDLCLQILSIIDTAKLSDNDLISEAAFDADMNIKYNIGKLSDDKIKQFQRLDMIKMQKEKRLLVREQFELEHEDA